MVATTRECPCYLPLNPPADEPVMIPSRDPEPGPEVKIVALWGQNPAVLRMERVATGWHTRGAAASHHEITPPEPWETVGFCYRGAEHPVVDVTPADGSGDA